MEKKAFGDRSDADSSTEGLGITKMSPRHKVEAWLAVMCKAGASDLILRAGRPARPRASTDAFGFLPGRVPGPGALLEVLEGVMGSDRMKIWRETGSVDAALQLDGLGRFRLNAYKQMGEPAVVVRRVSDKAPQLDSLELPTSDLTRISLRKRGLVLVTGIAGSGKSTTLAGHDPAHEPERRASRDHARGSDRDPVHGEALRAQPARGRHRLPELPRGLAPRPAPEART